MGIFHVHVQSAGVLWLDKLDLAKLRLCSIFVSYSKVEVNNCRFLLQFCFIAGYKNAMY